jgi:hypothetical protein
MQRECAAPGARSSRLSLETVALQKRRRRPKTKTNTRSFDPYTFYSYLGSTAELMEVTPKRISHGGRLS